jgi:hypothetical protein
MAKMANQWRNGVSLAKARMANISIENEMKYVAKMAMSRNGVSLENGESERWHRAGGENIGEIGGGGSNVWRKIGGGGGVAAKTKIMIGVRKTKKPVAQKILGGDHRAAQSVIGEEKQSMKWRHEIKSAKAWRNGVIMKAAGVIGSAIKKMKIEHRRNGI